MKEFFARSSEGEKISTLFAEEEEFLLVEEKRISSKILHQRKILPGLMTNEEEYALGRMKEKKKIAHLFLGRRKKWRRFPAREKKLEHFGGREEKKWRGFRWRRKLKERCC